MNTDQIFQDLKAVLDNNLISIDDYNEIINNLTPLKDFNEWFSTNKQDVNLSIEINNLLHDNIDKINSKISNVDAETAKEIIAKETANIVSIWSNTIGYEFSKDLELAIIQLLMLQ
jgi:hypothetical protein